MRIKKKQAKYVKISIPGGRAGTRETLRLMGLIVSKYKTDHRIRELALQITAHIPNKNYRGEAAAVVDFVKNTIRYVRDVNGVETLQSPIRTLLLRAGDCDDHAVMVGVLLSSIGHPIRFRAIGLTRAGCTHVLSETKIGPKWVSAETTENWPLGHLPVKIQSQMLHHIKR